MVWPGRVMSYDSYFSLESNIVRRCPFEKLKVNVPFALLSKLCMAAPKRLTIIAETVALLRDEAVRYSVSVRSELADALPQIVGDRVQLQQVVMNLIVNSIEAMKGVDGMREIIIQSQRAGNEQILVSASDTGIGLPPELAERIFDPFFTTKPHGTGMGLRISRSIVESHGGRLWAVASPGRGAIFHLNLPCESQGQSHNRRGVGA
jgi:signal transduction histidine kinase